MSSKPRKSHNLYGYKKNTNEYHKKSIDLTNKQPSKKICGRYYWMCNMYNIAFLNRIGFFYPICFRVKQVKEKK